jgi:hypothetical protein
MCQTIRAQTGHCNSIAMTDALSNQSTRRFPFPSLNFELEEIDFTAPAHFQNVWHRKKAFTMPNFLKSRRPMVYVQRCPSIQSVQAISP